MTIFPTARVSLLALSVFAVSNARAATPASIEIFRPKRTYPSGAACDLKRVDFRNFTYWEGEWMAPGEASLKDPVRVSRGKYSLHEQGGFDDISVKAVAHPDLGSAAVSLLHAYGGGSGNEELVVLVFRCVDGKLTNTQLIRGDGHGEGSGITFSDNGKKMTMSSVYDYAAHCCPRRLETAAYKFATEEYVLEHVSEKQMHYPHMEAKEQNLR